MEMHQIRYFLAVARTLNFTQAAEECNVAQPSLSRAIKKLEEELGGDLFRRERSLTHLTELGRIMQPLLTQAYDTASSAKMLATTFRKGGYAPLRLALSSAIDMRPFVGALSSLMETMPGLELKFFRGGLTEVAEHLKSGEFEIAVCGPLSGLWDRFRSWTLFTEEFRLFMHQGHALAANDSVPLAQLSNERLLTRPYCDVAELTTEMLTQHGIQPAVTDQAASDYDILALLEANVGVAIMAANTEHGPDVRCITIDGFEIECPIQLHTVVGRQHTPAAAGLIQLLRAANWKDKIGARGSRIHTATAVATGEAHA